MLLTSNQTNVLELILLPLQLGDRALNLELITNLEFVDVLAHLTIGVFLDNKVNVALSSFIGCRSVWADDKSGATVLLGDRVAGDDAGSNMKTASRILRQFETEYTGVVVNWVNFLELHGEIQSVHPCFRSFTNCLVIYLESLEFLGVKSSLDLFGNNRLNGSRLDSAGGRAVIVDTTGNTDTSEGCEKKTVAARLGWLIS